MVLLGLLAHGACSTALVGHGHIYTRLNFGYKSCQILPVSSEFEFVSVIAGTRARGGSQGRIKNGLEVGLQACLASFLCVVKRDKGRQSADDSSKEGRGWQWHDATSLCQGLIQLYLCTIRPNIVMFCVLLKMFLEY